MRKLLAVLAVVMALPIAVAGAAVSATVVVDHEPASGRATGGRRGRQAR